MNTTTTTTEACEKPVIGRAWSTAEFVEEALRHLKFDKVPRTLLLDLLYQADAILDLAIETQDGKIVIALEAVLDNIRAATEIITRTIPPNPDRDDPARA